MNSTSSGARRQYAYGRALLAEEHGQPLTLKSFDAGPHGTTWKGVRFVPEGSESTIQAL
jgi:hypothetical protein